MIDYLIENYQSLIKFSLFPVFFILFIWELLVAWVPAKYPILLRWWNNIFLYLTGYLLIAWVLPLAVIPLALYAQSHSIGLFNQINISAVIAILASLFIYDVSHYYLHRIYHEWPVLWRIHKVHHSDPDVDISTELRHHPLEILASVLVSITVIFALGLHPVGIIIRAILAQAVGLMSHANIKLADGVDSVMRTVFITPAMHRIHHSSWQPETDSNYGALFSFWDKLFGSYVAKPRNGHENMELGLSELRSERELWLDRMLLLPFRKTVTEQADPQRMKE